MGEKWMQSVQYTTAALMLDLKDMQNLVSVFSWS